MNAPPDAKRAATAPAVNGSQETDRLGGAITWQHKPTPTPVQAISELTGAVAFMAFWREQITERIERRGDMPVSELYDIPRDAAAWLRAAQAFHQWRGA